MNKDFQLHKCWKSLKNTDIYRLLMQELRLLGQLMKKVWEEIYTWKKWMDRIISAKCGQEIPLLSTFLIQTPRNIGHKCLIFSIKNCNLMEYGWIWTKYRIFVMEFALNLRNNLSSITKRIYPTLLAQIRFNRKLFL